MSGRYIISDLHLGHNNIAKFRAPTYGDISSEEHWGMALDGLRGIKKRSTLFLNGDIAFTREMLQEIKKLPCQNKILILGNHCLDRKDLCMRDLVEAYDQIYSLHKYKGFWLQHSPVHPKELRGKKNIHGHTHYELMEIPSIGGYDPRYINVCVEYTGYTPITWEYAISDEYFQECIKKRKEYDNIR